RRRNLCLRDRDAPSGDGRIEPNRQPTCVPQKPLSLGGPSALLRQRRQHDEIFQLSVRKVTEVVNSSRLDRMLRRQRQIAQRGMGARLVSQNVAALLTLSKRVRQRERTRVI